MPVREKEETKTPSRTIDIEVIIKDLDYTNDLYSFGIISSLAAPYPIFEFTMNLDPDDVILEGVFGEDPIKLTIMGTGEDAQMQESITIKLMLLDTDHSSGSKPILNNDSQKNSSSFKFMAVPVDAFKTITTNINEIYVDKSVKEIIEDLVNKYTDAELELGLEDINQEIIDQIMIPPTTLYRVIKENSHRGKMDGYLDNQFGIYDGITSVYCTHENKLKIFNLTKQMKKGPLFTIYQLSQGDDQDDIYDESLHGKAVYTFTSVSNSYCGNSKFSSISKNINHIIKPSDKLFDIIEQDLDDVISKYGMVDKNKKVQKNETVSNRKRYNIHHTGNEYSETFANSDVSSLIGSLSSIELTINGNFFIEDMLNIGSVVSFEPSNIEQIDLAGKFILYSTNLKFKRETTEWYKECNLRLVRSNKTN